MGEFIENLKQGINIATVNYFAGIFAANPGNLSPAPPADGNDVVNVNDYRKQFEQKPVLYWGERNNFPLDIQKQADLSSVFQGGMKVLQDHMRGQGFGLATPVFKDGQRILEEVDDAEVMDELYEIGYYEYWHDACGELPLWGNVWPQFLMNKSRDIVRIKLDDGPFCRLQKPSYKTGRVENLYVSAQWPYGIDKLFTDAKTAKDYKAWVKTIPLLDRYNYVDQLDLLTKQFTFASHIKMNKSGALYGAAPWHSLYANRWLAISGKVPEMLIRYYEAAVTINYLFYINQEWLLKRFPGYESWTLEEQAKKIKELQESYEKNLAGTDNAFKSLMLLFRFDTQAGKEVRSVVIDTMDNKLREGNFIPDSQMSDGQTLFTLGIDPSLLGVVVPGGKQSAGSGSNIREASLALQMRLRPDRELNHTAFYQWRDYRFKGDKKRKKLVIITRDYIINTLDQRAPAAAKETQPTN